MTNIFKYSHFIFLIGFASILLAADSGDAQVKYNSEQIISSGVAQNADLNDRGDVILSSGTGSDQTYVSLVQVSGTRILINLYNNTSIFPTGTIGRLSGAGLILNDRTVITKSWEYPENNPSQITNRIWSIKLNDDGSILSAIPETTPSSNQLLLLRATNNGRILYQDGSTTKCIRCTLPNVTGYTWRSMNSNNFLGENSNLNPVVFKNGKIIPITVPGKVILPDGRRSQGEDGPKFPYTTDWRLTEQDGVLVNGVYTVSTQPYTYATVDFIWREGSSPYQIMIKEDPTGYSFQTCFTFNSGGVRINDNNSIAMVNCYPRTDDAVRKVRNISFVGGDAPNSGSRSWVNARDYILVSSPYGGLRLWRPMIDSPASY